MDDTRDVGGRDTPSPARAGGRRGLLLLGAAGAAEVGLLAALAHWPGLPLPHPGFLLFGSAFVAYVVGAVAAARLGGGPPGGPRPGDDGEPAGREGAPAGPEGARTGGGGGSAGAGGGQGSSGQRGGRLRDGARAGAGGRGVAVVWGVALLLRLALLAPPPELSDDVWRYLWDGHVQLSGVNPYRYAPSDPALDPLETPYRSRINNPEVSTIYPPVAQLAFLLVALLGNTVMAAKLLWTAFDLATGWLLGRVARASGRNPRPVLLLYLWSPLLVVETAWNAHLDPLGLFGLALLLLLALRSRPVAAGSAVAWAALTKLAPAAAVPPLARRLGWRFTVAFLAATLLLYAPYLAAGSRLLSGAETYARHWRFNEGAFALLEWAVPGPVAPRVAAGVLVLAVVIRATWRGWGAERSLLWILGAGFVLSPTLHPWYALWMLPLAALRRSPAWILFTGTVFVGYWGLPGFLESGQWPRPVWGRLVIWLPVAVALAWETAYRRRGSAHHPRAPTPPRSTRSGAREDGSGRGPGTRSS